MEVNTPEDKWKKYLLLQDHQNYRRKLSEIQEQFKLKENKSILHKEKMEFITVYNSKFDYVRAAINAFKEEMSNLYEIKETTCPTYPEITDTVYLYFTPK